MKVPCALLGAAALASLTGAAPISSLKHDSPGPKVDVSEFNGFAKRGLSENAFGRAADAASGASRLDLSLTRTSSSAPQVESLRLPQAPYPGTPGGITEAQWRDMHNFEGYPALREIKTTTTEARLKQLAEQENEKLEKQNERNERRLSQHKP